MRAFVVAVILAVAASVLTACDSSPWPAMVRSSASAPTAVSVSAATPRAERMAAALHVVSGFTTVHVAAAPIGDDLVRAVTTPGSGVAPGVAVTGAIVTVTGRDVPGGNGSSSTLQLVLNPQVAWSVALDGGASTAVLDLTATKVATVSLAKGVSSLDVTLPASGGTTQLAITAGASHVTVHLAGDQQAQATLAAGAGSVTLGGVVHSGIGAGTTFATAGYPTAASRVDIECSAGVGTLIVGG